MLRVARRVGLVQAPVPQVVLERFDVLLGESGRREFPLDLERTADAPVVAEVLAR